MSKIAKSGADTMSAMGLTLHGITEFLAIVLMLFHAVWATWVLHKNDENKKETFHKFSIVVWLIWSITYFIEMILEIKIPTISSYIVGIFII
ncbi:TIGR03987 family protein [Terrisporobacter petrolearius]|nr:TIGR03987 family protein [Terrisporobacter petrolearius]